MIPTTRTKLEFVDATNSIGQVGKITCEEGFQFVGNTLYYFLHFQFLIK